jgi:hypothetical protein
MTATNAKGRHGGSASFMRRLRMWAAKAVNATRRAKRLVDAVPEPPPAPAPAEEEGRLGDSDGATALRAESGTPSAAETAGALKTDSGENGDDAGDAGELPQSRPADIPPLCGWPPSSSWADAGGAEDPVSGVPPKAGVWGPGESEKGI